MYEVSFVATPKPLFDKIPQSKLINLWPPDPLDKIIRQKLFVLAELLRNLEGAKKKEHR